MCCAGIWVVQTLAEKEGGTEAINSGIYLWFGLRPSERGKFLLFYLLLLLPFMGMGYSAARVLPLFCAEYIFLRTHVFVRL